jgi:hypothetical protein
VGFFLMVKPPSLLAVFFGGLRTATKPAGYTNDVTR